MPVILRRVLHGSAFPTHDFDLDPTPYLASYDPDYVHPGVDYPTGLAGWTADPAQAMHFETVMAAIETWRTQSATRPLRPDGEPNRPLSAYSMTPEVIE